MAKKKFTPDEIKHLEFIQDVVSRTNSNSFQMKGWMVAIVSALLAIFADRQNDLYVLVALIPTFIFWGLDAYYLQQERKFRGVYNDVAGLSKSSKEIQPFAMPIHQYTEDSYSYWNVFGSRTIILLYLPVVLILLGIYFFL
ncbi:MAG: hypothetical protein DPW18_12235 [Chloroflexi bacterium]|nr:hypothetical protein [Chloroflexota bacterium]MDL1944392.1 hypothetical protein [Chloroflexi bacterium CFX2]